jgi:hypothetical protein
VVVASVTLQGVVASTQQWNFTLYDPEYLQASDDIEAIITNRLSPLTILEVWCKSDDATALTTINFMNNGGMQLLPSHLNCSIGGAPTSTLNPTASDLLINDRLDFVAVTVGANVKRINVVIKYAQH